MSAEVALKRFVKEGGYHRQGVGHNTHSTADNNIASTPGRLWVPLDRHDELLTCVSKDFYPSVQEHVDARFRMFLQCQFAEQVDINDCDLRHISYIATEAFASFFPQSVHAELFEYTILLHCHMPQTMLRVVFPSLIVDTPRALRMHAMFVSLAHEKLRGKLREKVTGCDIGPDVEDPSMFEPSISPQWSVKFPGNVYLPATRLAMAYTHTSGGTLEPRMVLSGTDQIEDAAALKHLKELRDSKLHTLRRTCVRSVEDLSEPHDPPRDCPLVPQKLGPRGMELLDAFRNEKSAAKVGPWSNVRRLDGRQADSFDIADKLTLQAFLQEIRAYGDYRSPPYMHTHIVRVERRGRIDGKHIYRATVGGRGSSYCPFILAHHQASHDGGARVIFEADRDGLHIVCNCDFAVRGRSCKGRRTAAKPMMTNNQNRLGFVKKQKNDDFGNTLRDYLLPITNAIASGERLKKRRRGRFGT